MSSSAPRIASVKTVMPTTISVRFRSGRTASIDLAGWIATGGHVLAPLLDPEFFATARTAEHGAAVSWDGGEGDLSIDVVHLEQLAAEQRPFASSDLAAWQRESGLSNQEAKDLLGVSLSTYNAYKAGSSIPPAIGMVCRAVRRDPILLQAHYKPRKPGRPRKRSSARKRA